MRAPWGFDPCCQPPQPWDCGFKGKCPKKCKKEHCKKDKKCEKDKKEDEKDVKKEEVVTQEKKE